MKKAALWICLCLPLNASDGPHTAITWGREISRIFVDRCISCHREGGGAFSLGTYADVRPWALAIKEQVRRRRMPPWGAIKGFGSFRNDYSLSPENIKLIVSWVEGGTPEGNSADVARIPNSWANLPLRINNKGTLVQETSRLKRSITIQAVTPHEFPRQASSQLTAELPSSEVIPLLWLHEYDQKFGHSFVLRSPLKLPAGTIIRGIPPGSSVTLHRNL